MDILRVFSQNIRKYRKEKGFSQEKLGEIADLHRTYISDVERCERSISLYNIQKIADVLEVDTYKLFMEEK